MSFVERDCAQIEFSRVCVEFERRREVHLTWRAGKLSSSAERMSSIEFRYPEKGLKITAFSVQHSGSTNNGERSFTGRSGEGIL